MSEHKINVTAILKDEVTPQIKKIEGSTNQLKSSMSGLGSSISGAFGQFTLANLAAEGIGKIISGIKSFVEESSKAYQDSEKNSRMLGFAITSMAGGSKKDLEDLKSVAEDSLHGLWTESEVEKAITPMIEMYDMPLNKVKELIPLIGEYATVSGKGLDAAASSIAKGMNGMGRDFKAVGVHLEKLKGDYTDTAVKAQNLATIQEFLNTKIGAMGEFADTATGQLQKMNAELELQKEKLGEASTSWDIFSKKVQTFVAETLSFVVAPGTSTYQKYQKSAEDYAKENTKDIIQGSYTNGTAAENWNLIKDLRTSNIDLQREAQAYINSDSNLKGIKSLKDFSDFQANPSNIATSTYYSDNFKQLGATLLQIEKQKALANKIEEIQTTTTTTTTKDLTPEKSTKDTTLKTKTTEDLSKTSPVKSLTINITKMVGVETIETTNLGNSTTAVGDALIKELEKAVFDAASIAYTK